MTSALPFQHFPTFLLLMLLTLSVSAQHKDSVEYRSPYRDLRPIRCVQTSNVNRQGNLDGAFTIKGSDNLNSGQRTDEQQYTESRQYSDGELNGMFTQAYSHSGSGQISGKFTISHHWVVSGKFVDGLPDGTWTFSVASKLNSYNDKENTNLTETVEFNNGAVTSISDQQGNYLQVTPEGKLTGVGTLKDGTRVILNNSIITNSYIDLTGELHKLNDQQTFYLRKLIDGEWSVYDLADRGYTIDWNESFISQWARYVEHADRYANLDKIAPHYTLPSYSVRLGQLREVKLVDDDKAVEYYRQRPKMFYDMISKGCYQGPYGKKYFGSNAANRIQQQWAQDQGEVLSRKLSLIARIEENDSWSQCLTDCVEGNSPMLDLIAWQRSRQDLSEEETYREAAQLFKEKFTTLYPLVGHHIDSIAWQPHEGITAQCTLYRQCKDSTGYESYVVDIQTDMDGYILIGRMEPDQYRRTANLWDTVYDFERQLATQHSNIVSKMGQLKEYRNAYKEYYDERMADKTIRPEVRMNDLKDIDTLQRQLTDNIPVLTKIEQQNVELRKQLQSYPHLYHAYKDYFENYKPEWDDTTERLTDLQDYQKALIEAIATADMQEVERSSKRAKSPLTLLATPRK